MHMDTTAYWRYTKRERETGFTGSACRLASRATTEPTTGYMYNEAERWLAQQYHMVTTERKAQRYDASAKHA